MIVRPVERGAPGRIDRSPGWRLAALSSLAVLAVLAAAPRRARAEEKIAVLDVSVTGVPADAGPRFEASLEEGLRGAGFAVVPRARVIEKLIARDAPEGCAFGPCLAAVGRTLGVGLVLVARVTAQGPSYTFVVTLVDAATGIPTAQVSDSCAVCTLDEALASATLAVVSLGTRTGAVDLTASAAWRDRYRERQRRARRIAWTLVSVAAAAAVTGGALLVMDVEPAAFGALGAAGGLGAAGVVLFVTGD